MQLRLSILIIIITFPYQVFSQEGNKTNPYFHDSVKNRKVYLVVDKAPETSMDIANLWKYVMDNNLWPPMDTSCWFHKILLSFIVEPNGSVSGVNVQILGSVFCDDAVRLLNSKTYMIDNFKNSVSRLHWTPGELKEQKVPVLIRIPIHVHLNFD